MAAKKRLPAFDIAKAVALIAVIIGHTSSWGMPQAIVDFCYSFDMPLFFFVSGYFCRPDVTLDKAYVVKNLKALIIPYIATSILIIVAATLVQFFLYHEGVFDTCLKWCLAALYGAGGTFEGTPAGIIGIGAIWFLWALFWNRMLLPAVNKTPAPFLFVVCLFIIGYYTGDRFWLPLSLQPAFCSLIFVYAGQKVRAWGLLERGGLHPLLWCVALFAWLYCGAFYGQVYMVETTYAHGLIDIVGGICGALCVIKGAQLIADRSPVLVPLELLGRITLGMFCLHLVELNCVPWDLVSAWLTAVFPAVPMWASVLVLRFLIIAVLTGLFWILPRPISGIFFPQRKAVRKKAHAA